MGESIRVPRVLTVPSGVAFLPEVARFLVGEVTSGGARALDPAALAAATVYLPTRRATRAFAVALHETVGRAVLLPRVRALGEWADEDDPMLYTPGAEGDAGQIEVVGEAERRMVLADIAREWAATTPRWADRAPEIGPHPVPATPGEAAALAIDLARLFDEMTVAGTSGAALDDLLPEDLNHLARNWRINLEFLTHALDRWTAHLARRGLVERVARRDRALTAEAERMANAADTAPVIAAGSTGSVPAAARLLRAIATRAGGAVILPGLDTDLDEASWRAVGPDHPQFGMKRLIASLGSARGDVAVLGDAAPLAPRRRLVSEAMRPAATADLWVGGVAKLDKDAVRRALAKVSLVEAHDEHEEARVVALMLRRAAEDGERRTALVTPERGLARRVAAELARWGMAIDDSAGRPLDQTRQGVFMRLVADAPRGGFVPVPLLALLKHPLARLGFDVASARRAARVIELLVLRGPRPGSGIAALRGALDAAEARPARHPVVARLGADDFALARKLLGRLEAAFAPLSARFAGSAAAPARELLVAHIEAAEALAATPAGEAPALWRGEAGEALSAFLAEAIRAAGEAGPLKLAEFGNWLGALMIGRAVRPRRRGDDRIAILGPLEARMQPLDRVILAGLNEGAWPIGTEVDPWLGRPLREALGLDPPERRIGLQAHDVVEGMMAPEVVLTRAGKTGGTPTVRSRWLWRIVTLLDGLGLKDALAPETPWLDIARALDAGGEAAPWPPPRPAPPLAARPRRLSVTRIETWIRDPYAIYAREVLGLAPLEEIDAEPGAADYGLIIHSALGTLIARYPQAPLPADALGELFAIGREAFKALDHRPGLRAYWWLRFERIARWFVAADAGHRPPGTVSHAEVPGRIEIASPDADGPFTLTARADRIDIDGSGRAAIVDYKTGRAPGEREIAAMLAPQLPLEAMMLTDGGFDALGALEVTGLAHVTLTGREPPGALRPAPDAPHELAAEARRRLGALIARYADEAQPYLSRVAPQREEFVGDYDHLARVGEWSLGLGRRHDR